MLISKYTARGEAANASKPTLIAFPSRLISTVDEALAGNALEVNTYLQPKGRSTHTHRK